MKLGWPAALLLLSSTGVTSLSIPQSGLIERDAFLVDTGFVGLEKRRGGGGGGRGGGGFSGGGSGGRSSSSSSSSGSSRGGGGGRTSSSSNIGGSSRRGSGVSPHYGGGRYDKTFHSTSVNYDTGHTFVGDRYSGYSGYLSYWPWVVEETRTPDASKTIKAPKSSRIKAKTYGRYYAGGASTPYAAGHKSPGGITPRLVFPAALLFPGVWLYGAWAYHFSHPYVYTNEQNHKNESLPVVCLCQPYDECGCDDNHNRTYYETLFNGTQPINTTITRVTDVNGTETIYINGTLANGTTAASTSAAPTSAVTLLHASGYWVTVAVVATAVWAF